MKWPTELTWLRHDTSAYNELKKKKENDPLYKQFLAAFKKDINSDEMRTLARAVKLKFALGVGDACTPLADKEGRQAFETGQRLGKERQLPDIIFVSPYTRALDTLKHVTRGWPALKEVKVVEEERVREQEHGLALIYNDWRVFHALHPEQAELYELEGSYYYRYPQGESVPDVRKRIRSFLTTITRDFAEKRILVVSHHLSILALRANLERFGAKRFKHIDQHEKPINCGVTIYRGNPDKGQQGRLELEIYNAKYYR